MSEVPQLVIDVETFIKQHILRATGGGTDVHQYTLLRRKFLAEPELRSRLPQFVMRYGDLDGFWEFIQPKFQHYAERRAFIREEFAPLLAYAEGKTLAPADAAVGEVLDLKPDYGHVRAAWLKTPERRDSDPDGAITSARTLLESLCKHILDELGVTYDPKADLPPLYNTVAAHLGLLPGGKDAAGNELPHGAKQSLQGCQNVVQGFANLRNVIGDAHGKGKGSMRAEPRHAELAANMAFTLATFLVRTFEKRKAGAKS